MADIACVLKTLPDELLVAAAETAVKVNPANAPPPLPQLNRALSALGLPEVDDPGRLSLLTNKYWGAGGVKLTVGFMEPTAVDLRDRILSHMNAWKTVAGANVEFKWTQTDPQVRIAFKKDGYWSYLGTDILHIPKNQPTMNLQGFTMSTPESEYKRVVRHETGHTLGYPHEQQLPEIVGLLDVAKTIAWGKSALGWDEATVRSQILTPLDPHSLRMTAHADVNGIMCYQLPASITKDGQAIPGGLDIDEIDAAFARTVYPLTVDPPKPPPKPNPNGGGLVDEVLKAFANQIIDTLQAFVTAKMTSGWTKIVAQFINGWIDAHQAELVDKLVELLKSVLGGVLADPAKLADVKARLPV